MAAARTAFSALRPHAHSTTHRSLRQTWISCRARARRESTLAAPGSSVNPDEVAHFARLSNQWWDEDGELAGMLHRMNPCRMRFIREKVIETARMDGADVQHEARPFAGMRVLDVGCGGGLLSESLARSGGTVLGIDAVRENVGIATVHSTADPALTAPPSDAAGSLRYEHSTVEDLLAHEGSGQYDMVCSLEVLEHVDNPSAFLRNCAALVKPGGHLFLSTISRTPLSFALSIAVGEYLTNLVARGTHSWDKFVRPDELYEFFHKDVPWTSRNPPSYTQAESRGLIWVPGLEDWTLVPRSAPWARTWAENVNYMFWVRRPKTA